MSTSQEVQDSNSAPIQRNDGVTHAERYLKKLCDKTFLSLWSYPGVYRDQGRSGLAGDGKEVCDLLVVFEGHVIIFSDKDCAFPNTGDIDLDWSRWFRRAVEASAKQVWGAERWINQFPNRLFLDRACTQPFPLTLPAPASAKFHRIVVAHDSVERCKQEFGGGSGSLMITPDITGNAHYTKRVDGGTPFAIGQLDLSRGFVHVLDDVALRILLSTLDTVTDFVAYLTQKEHFIKSGQLTGATGEEDLLAYYLTCTDGAGGHGFILPEGHDHLVIGEGAWEGFAHSPQRLAQLDVNDISYTWDRLIESFNGHFFARTQYFASAPDADNHNQIMRFLAGEPRTRRRLLSRSLLEVIHARPKWFRRARVFFPSHPGDPFYVFLVLDQPSDVPYEQYREARRALLEAYCMVTKLKYPHALDIVGIATEPASEDMNVSEDAAYFNGREWTSEEQAQAKGHQREMGLLSDIVMARGTETEYPPLTRTGKLATAKPGAGKLKGRDRNSPCPCGSGRKLKHCCGKRGGGTL